MNLQTLPKPSPAFPFRLVRKELELVEKIVHEQAVAFDPGVSGYISYICNSAGKRIRPALAILTGGATGGVTEDHRRLSAILELIHIASLVHDDIMDGAIVRREAPTASAKWGATLSVLLGDSLFAHALELATEFDDASIPRRIARASREVCCGEILQTQRRFDFNLSLEEYFRMIEMKTAALFAAATELGAYLNGQPEPIVAALRGFGSKLGTAYQIYDDCLDLMGDEKIVGKTLGTDLAKGKLTLPMLYLLRDATDSQRAKLHKMVLKGEPMDTTILAGIADYEGAIERAIRTAVQLLNEARTALSLLPGTKYLEALECVVGYLQGLLEGCKGAA